MAVDNRKNIRKFLLNELTPECENKEFYKFDVMVRNKDDRSNPYIKNHKGSFLLHSWLISTVEQYDKYIDEMTALCDATGARLYMTLDRKSTQFMAIQLADYANDLIKSMVRKNTLSTKNIFNVMNSLTSKKELSVHNSRKLLFDIDTDNWDEVEDLIDILIPISNAETGTVYILPSPNGWHVVTNRFNRDLISITNENIDVKENALTIVYFNKEEEVESE